MRLNISVILSIVLICEVSFSCKPARTIKHDISGPVTYQSGNNQQTPSDKVDQVFDGKYSSVCTNESGSGEIRSSDGKFSIQGPVLYTEVNWYSNITCSGNLIYKVTKQTILTKIKEYKGGTVFDGRLSSATATIYTQDLVNMYNNSSWYGYSDWKTGESKDITSQLRNEEKDDGTYTFLKLDGSTLYVNSYDPLKGDLNPSVEDATRFRKDN